MNAIDEIDAKIIKDLLRDGRKSFAEIADQCCTSKDVIAKRYKKMKQDRIIVGATIQMNYRFFGHDAVADIFINVDPQEIDKVIKNIEKLPNIFVVFPSYDKRHIIACATLKDLSELDHVKDAIKKQPTVLKLKTYLWTGTKNIPENLSIGSPIKSTKTKDGNSSQKSNGSTKKADELDRQIIERLAEKRPFTFHANS